MMCLRCGGRDGGSCHSDVTDDLKSEWKHKKSTGILTKKKRIPLGVLRVRHDVGTSSVANIQE